MFIYDIAAVIYQCCDGLSNEIFLIERACASSAENNITSDDVNNFILICPTYVRWQPESSLAEIVRLGFISTSVTVTNTHQSTQPKSVKFHRMS